MVSLRWADVLSTLLPGSLALRVVAPHIPPLAVLLDNINAVTISSGVAFLGAGALAGGLLEAITRLTWERWVLQRVCKSPDALISLGKDPSKIDLYERGVQNSYKYSTFYANFAWATLMLPFARSQLRLADVILALACGTLLLCASYVQWTYFVNYLKRVFVEEKNDA